jgi:hypothetical protein
MYSASIDDAATAGMSFVCYAIGPPAPNNMYPEVDRRELMSPA